jgi:hypothetical protein
MDNDRAANEKTLESLGRLSASVQLCNVCHCVVVCAGPSTALADAQTLTLMVDRQCQSTSFSRITILISSRLEKSIGTQVS